VDSSAPSAGEDAARAVTGNEAELAAEVVEDMAATQEDRTSLVIPCKQCYEELQEEC
jgi:hypothetical protein